MARSASDRVVARQSFFVEEPLTEGNFAGIEIRFDRDRLDRLPILRCEGTRDSNGETGPRNGPIQLGYARAVTQCTLGAASLENRYATIHCYLPPRAGATIEWAPIFVLSRGSLPIRTGGNHGIAPGSRAAAPKGIISREKTLPSREMIAFPTQFAMRDNLLR